MLDPNEYSDIFNIVSDRFMNRKGFSGILGQAGCDAWCRFCLWESNWPSCVTDITDWQQTSFYIS
jgi:hypothetical protein